MSEEGVEPVEPASPAASSEEPRSPSQKPRKWLTPRRLVLFAFGLSGTAALIYEVAWTRELSLVFGSTVYAVSIMLAAFMSGLSLGSYLGGRWADKRNPVVLYGMLELGIGIFGVLSVPLMRVLPAAYFILYTTLKPPFVVFFLLQFLLSFVVMLVPTVLMGATFPAVAKMNTRSLAQSGHEIGDVYSINTLGSVAGSVAAGFLLIPLIGVKGAVFTAAALNVVVGAMVMYLARSSKGGKRAIVAAVAVVAIAALGAALPDAAVALGFYRFGRITDYRDYLEYEKRLKTLYSDDGLYSRVVVTEDAAGERSLQNGGMVEGSSGLADVHTTSLLALLPVASAESPSSALVIGLGTGYTSRAMLTTSVPRVSTVEINPAVLDASRYFVGDSLESDSRWELHIDDARNYLLMRPGATYDIITSEPSWPMSSGVANLFTKEFFELARDRLSDDGVYCQWLPRYLLTREDFMMMYKTFRSVFPNTYVWGIDAGADAPSNDLILIAIKGDRKLDMDAVQNAVTLELASRGLNDVPFHPFASTVTMQESLTDPSIPLNTDDHPLLEFDVVRTQVKWLAEGAFEPSGSSVPSTGTRGGP